MLCMLGGAVMSDHVTTRYDCLVLQPVPMPAIDAGQELISCMDHIVSLLLQQLAEA